MAQGAEGQEPCTSTWRLPEILATAFPTACFQRLSGRERFEYETRFRGD